MNITLKEWAPAEFEQSFNDVRAYRYADVKVVEEFSMFEDDEWKPWPGTHKNVTSWCILENGYAVGWNENPSIGWSFPVVKAPKL
jgi:hypothetical protein